MRSDGPIRGRAWRAVRETEVRGVAFGLSLVTTLVLIVALAAVALDGRPGGGPDRVTVEDRAVALPSAAPSSDGVAPPPPPPGSEPAPAPPATEVEGPLVEPDPGGDVGDAPAPPPTYVPAPPRVQARQDTAVAPPRTSAGVGAGSAAQSEASQDSRDPASLRWAVLIGVNEHSGSTRSNVGSRQDAEDLYATLRHLGWYHDHILVLTDGAATRAAVEQAIAWLASKTTEESVAVFHYSGHTKQWPGYDPDGDGESPDEALWPSDNRHMTDRELVDRLAQVPAGRLWVDIGACEAEGYADPGLRQPGRILTFSSGELEKSYEDPSIENSVWGYFMIERALMNREADADGDGDVTVQEAFNWAAPRATQRTEGASKGAQHPQIMDDVGEPFSLAIPAPPPEPEPEPEPEPSSEPDPTPTPTPPPPPGDEDDCGLPICPVP